MTTDPSERSSHWLKLVSAGLLLGVVLLWLTFRGVDSGELLRILRSVDYRSVLAAYLLAVLGCVVRAFQWQMVLASRKRVPAHRLFRSIMIGFLYNFLMPVRMGEVVRTAYTAKQEKLPFTTVLTTVALTRVLDVFALLTLWVYASLFSDLFSYFHGQATLTGPIVATSKLLAFLALAALVVAGLLSGNQVRSYRLARLLLRRFASGSNLTARAARGILDQVANFLRGLRMLRTWRHLLAAFALSLVVWLLSATVIDQVLEAFDVDLPFAASIFVMMIIALGIAVPAVPGYVGQFHAACRYALAPFAVSVPKAASIALFLHAFHFSYTLVLGGLAMLGGGWTWSKVRRLDATHAPPGGAEETTR
jgi:hypothetical protein